MSRSQFNLQLTSHCRTARLQCHLQNINKVDCRLIDGAFSIVEMIHSPSYSFVCLACAWRDACVVVISGRLDLSDAVNTVSEGGQTQGCSTLHWGRSLQEVEKYKPKVILKREVSDTHRTRESEKVCLFIDSVGLL